MLSARHFATATAALALSITPLFAQEQEASKGEAQAEPSETATADKGEAGPGPVTEASPTDFREGMEVRDTQGGLVGTVESIDNEGAVVNTGNRKAKLPFGSFGKNDAGLVISLSRTELEAAAAAQSPS